MKYQDLVGHFGGLSKAAQVLGLSRQTVHAWKTRKRIPARWQVKAEAMTDGQLRADTASRREAYEMASYVNGARGHGKRPKRRSAG